MTAFGNNIGNQQQVTTHAGALPTPDRFGTPGTTNSTGTDARFDIPKGMVRDANGNLYVTEFNNFTIRKIDAAKKVTTLAGNITVQGTKDGTATAAEFGGPYGIAILDATWLVVRDY